MGRPRKKNKHLPSRVYWNNGAFRFVTKDNKWIALGRTMAEMYSKLSELQMRDELVISRFKQLAERYIQEIAPLKSKSSFKSNLTQSRYLITVFGEMLIEDITPVDIYKYLDIRGKKSKVSANREFALLSHMFSYAMRWGASKVNPCIGVKKFSEKRRSRNVTDKEYEASLKMAPYPINAVMELTYMMGLRPTEVLQLKRSNAKEEGFYVEITKTKNSVAGKMVEWSTPLKKLVYELIQKNKYKISHLDYLVCNRVGQPYTPDGFSSLWRRFMDKCIDEKVIDKSFQLRDLRHKSATDMEKMHGREEARKLLGHTTQSTTARYIDGVNVVKGITK